MAIVMADLAPTLQIRIARTPLIGPRFINKLHPIASPAAMVAGKYELETNHTNAMGIEMIKPAIGKNAAASPSFASWLIRLPKLAGRGMREKNARVRASFSKGDYSSLLDTLALSKVAISLSIAQAFRSSGNASKAPEPSPKRSSKSNRGSALKASNMTLWPGSFDLCA